MRHRLLASHPLLPILSVAALLVFAACTPSTGAETQRRAQELPIHQGSLESFEKPADDVLRKELSDIQYEVTQQDGTERPFRNAYWDHKKDGIYVDVVSGEPLFSSTHKFESGTGWPSFTRALVPENVVDVEDRSFGMVRTEVRSKHADSHLGHVFPDGPEPTGLRYCINSAALHFVPADELEAEGYGEFTELFE